MNPRYAALLAGLTVVVFHLAAVSSASAGEIPIVIEQQAFAPQVTTIHVGDHVTWRNHDNGDHFLTSSGPTSRLVATQVEDLEFHRLLTPGSNYSHSFKAPGIYGYFCAIHLGMWGTIVVEP